MKNYTQLVVWPACVVGKADEKRREFQQLMLDDGFRVKYAGEFETLPTPGDTSGKTGGRNDLLFYIHNDDVGKFAIWRLRYGMRWWEDYLDNGSDEIVPREILKEHGYNWDKAEVVNE